MPIANSSKVVTFQANRELVNDAMEVLKEKNLSLSSASNPAWGKISKRLISFLILATFRIAASTEPISSAIY